MPAAPSALHPDLPDLADPDSILRNGRRLDTDTCHKRLLFRNWHRGAQEIDLILASFAERCLTDFRGAQLARLEALLDCSDVDLFDWVTGRSIPPLGYDYVVTRMLRASHCRYKDSLWNDHCRRSCSQSGIASRLAQLCRSCTDSPVLHWLSAQSCWRGGRLQ